jgi:hypothetical protein
MADSPWFIREDGTEFGEQSWSVFKPKWLDEFCVQNPAAGPKVCVKTNLSECVCSPARKHAPQVLSSSSRPHTLVA